MLAFLLLSITQGLEPAPATPFDKLIALEIKASDPVLAGHGPSVRVEYSSEFSGTLHLWPTATAELDLFLRLEDERGKQVAEDDNSGGGRTPYLKLETESGRKWTVLVAAATPGSAGKLELHLVAAPETAVSRAAAEEGQKTVLEIQRLREAGERARARQLCGETIAALEAHVGESELVNTALWDLAAEAYELSLEKPVAELFALISRHRLRTLPEAHHALLQTQLNLAWMMSGLGDFAGARVLEERLLKICAKELPAEHPDLLAAQLALAATLGGQGDRTGERTLEQHVLEVYLRTLPADDPDLQVVRSNLATSLRSLGDLAGARVLQEQVLEVYARTLPDDHAQLQLARKNLAWTLSDLGDLAGVRALREQVLEAYSRAAPDDDPDLQDARTDLSLTVWSLGDFPRALSLEQQVLAVRLRTLPADHLDVQRARLNLGATLFAMGDRAGARDLDWAALEACSCALPDEDPTLQTARENYALTIQSLGDLAGARVLLEKVLEVRTRTLFEDHPDLQRTRGNLATTIEALGDLAGARALEERVIQVLSRSRPADDLLLQWARVNLANTLVDMGDHEGARTLEEEVLQIYERTLPEEHPNVQAARGNLAATLRALGDPQDARVLEERVLQVRLRTLPEDHPDLQAARGNLAVTLGKLGDLEGARLLEEQTLQARLRSLPDDHRDLQRAREHLAFTIMRLILRDRRAAGEQLEAAATLEARRVECSGLVQALCRAEIHSTHSALLQSTSREAEERCTRFSESIGTALSFAGGFGVFAHDPELEYGAFLLSETTRGAALVSAALTRKAAGTPAYAARCEALATASAELADLAHKGATPEAFDRARTRRESAERALVELARGLSRASGSVLEFDAGKLAARLQAREAAVGYRSYDPRWTVGNLAPDSAKGTAAHGSSDSRLGAFVVRGPRKDDGPGTAHLDFIDLGPIEPIETATSAWRAALDVGAERGIAAGAAGIERVIQRGNELRKLVIDPLAQALGDAQHVVVALDDVLNLVPLEALPLADGQGLVGERWRIETRATLTELLQDPTAPLGSLLVALGGASFNVPPLELRADEVPGLAEEGPIHVAALLRGTAWERGFEPLTHTADEARGVGALYTELFGKDCPVAVLEKRKASREALEELAPKARFLHIATHGWFARESIRSWSDPEPLDRQSGVGHRLSGAEQVASMSPMLLCGLALAGANLSENEVGRVPGLVTAEELSALDLTNCELVVLSACDTNVGERRAGQGVHSLQMALQMAGARSVITSLWKVPDEATKELMLDFYRRLWVEKKPKWQALWEAKKKLREAKDEAGKPKYTTRDWAAWVLTGDPN